MVTELSPGTRHRARLTGQGQITVPKAVRDALGAQPGDDVEFVPRGTEMLIEVRPRRSILDFAGIASRAAGRIPTAAEELDTLIERAIADAAVARELRVQRRYRKSQ